MGLPAHSLRPLAEGWVVRLKVITTAYKYFITLNSSVRGPFIPPYLVSINRSSFECRPHQRTGASLTRSCILQGKVAWHRLFTKRLTSDVLLVGPT